MRNSIGDSRYLSLSEKPHNGPTVPMWEVLPRFTQRDFRGIEIGSENVAAFSE